MLILLSRSTVQYLHYSTCLSHAWCFGTRLHRHLSCETKILLPSSFFLGIFPSSIMDGSQCRPGVWLDGWISFGQWATSSMDKICFSDQRCKIHIFADRNHTSNPACLSAGLPAGAQHVLPSLVICLLSILIQQLRMWASAAHWLLGRSCRSCSSACCAHIWSTHTAQISINTQEEGGHR